MFFPFIYLFQPFWQSWDKGRKKCTLSKFSRQVWRRLGEPLGSFLTQFVKTNTKREFSDTSRGRVDKAFFRLVNSRNTILHKVFSAFAYLLFDLTFKTPCISIDQFLLSFYHELRFTCIKKWLLWICLNVNIFRW